MNLFRDSVSAWKLSDGFQVDHIKILDAVAAQSGKIGYSLFMASWLSWKSPVPKLGGKNKANSVTQLHLDNKSHIILHFRLTKL